MRPILSSHVSSGGTSDVVSTEREDALSCVPTAAPISPVVSPRSHLPLGESSKCLGVATPACHMDGWGFLGLSLLLQCTKAKYTYPVLEVPSCPPAGSLGFSPSLLRHSGWPAAYGGQRCGGHTFSCPS